MCVWYEIENVCLVCELVRKKDNHERHYGIVWTVYTADYGLIASLVLRVGRNNREVLAVRRKNLLRSVCLENSQWSLGTLQKSPSSLLCHPYWTLQCGDQREGHDSGSWPMTEHLGGETGDLNKTAVLPNSVGCMWLAWCCWACLACLLLFTRLAWLIAAKERHGTVTGGREADLDCPLCVCERAHINIMSA